MTAKEYLMQARKLDGQVQAKIEQIARLRASINRSSGLISGMPRGGKGQDWTDVVAKAADMEAVLKAQINELLEVQTEIAEAIAAVDDPDGRTILTYRYLSGWSWDRIADTMHYDRVTIWRKHGYALLKIKVPAT